MNTLYTRALAALTITASAIMGAPNAAHAAEPTGGLHGCPKPSSGYRLCAIYPADSPKGWSFIIDSTGALVAGDYGVTGAGRSIVDSDGRPGKGGDDVTPLGRFKIQCWTERTTQKESAAKEQAELESKLANGGTDEERSTWRKRLKVVKQLGTSCQGWPAAPGLRYAGRFNGVMDGPQLQAGPR